jgi:hypothetical protein
VEGFHHLDHGDVVAGVEELMVGLGGIGPAPSVGERMELSLAYRTTGLAKEDVVIGVRIKWRIEIDEIDADIGEFARVAQPFEVSPK